MEPEILQSETVQPESVQAEAFLRGHGRMDRETLKKAFAWTSRHSVAFLLIGGVLMLAFAISVAYLRGLRDFLPYVLFLSAIAYVVVALRLPGRFVRLQLRRIEELYQSDHVDLVTVFGPEDFTHCGEGTEPSTHIRYGSLRNVAELPGMILLWTKTKQFALLDPARFENGTEEDFWKLMNEKCPQAVPKKLRQG